VNAITVVRNNAKINPKSHEEDNQNPSASQ